MFLYIMRHGQAEPSSSSDRARELTGPGRREVSAVARGLRERIGSVDRILCSPYTRTRQTAGLLADGMHLDSSVIEPVESLASGGSAQDALDWLTAHVQGDVIVVGHMPMVAELATMLLSGHRADPLNFHPATVLALEAAVIAPACAEELWQRHPFQW